jgi:hypothetical protein
MVIGLALVFLFCYIPGRSGAAANAAEKDAVANVGVSLPTTVVFKIYRQDIGVRAEGPKKAVGLTTPGHTVLMGAQITVLLSDLFEVVSVQCHWDGVSTKGQYAYTLWYRPKEATWSETPHLSCLSFDLNDFETSYPVGGDAYLVGQRGINRAVRFERVGILPAPGSPVSFETAPAEIIARGADPSRF